MGNIFCDYDFSVDDVSVNDPIAIRSVDTPIPNTVIDDIMENWKKIQFIIEQSCLGKKKITKEQLALWRKYYIYSKNFFKKSSLFFPFNVVALGVVKRYKFMLLQEKNRAGELTPDDLTSLRQISLELKNDITEFRKRYNEIELDLLALEIEIEKNSSPTL